MVAVYGTNGPDDLHNYSNFSDVIMWGRAGDDTLTGNQFVDHLFGEADDDELLGREGDDILNGSTGNDTLNGGKGADVLVGGSGWDMADYFSSYKVTVDLAAGTGSDDEAEGDTYSGIENLGGGGGDDHLYGNSGDNDIFGRGADDILAGREGPDFLDGGYGDDILNGGTGADILQGGFGDDIYLVDSLADLATEFSGQGTDTVKSSVSFSLVDKYIENVILTGSSNVNATGNSYDNRLTGNAGLNILKGGFGDDVYVVQNDGDVVVEYANQGIDTVQASINYILDDPDLENLTLIGSGDIFGVGNASNNVIRGNLGENVLLGLKGNDTYYVQNKGDLISEVASGGYDKVISTASFKLAENVEYLKLTGSADIDGFGNTGINTLIGNNGDNDLWGGTGSDTYYVQGEEDRVYEPQNGGYDIVYSTGNFSLEGQYAEDLVLTDDSNWHVGAGNDLDNTIVGSDGSNTLAGEGGDDVLIGGDKGDFLHGNFGQDKMFGGDGVDEFVFFSKGDTSISAATRDKILDFEPGIDAIDLDFMDANANGAGNQAFSFLAAKGAAFTGVAGQLRWLQVNKPGEDKVTVVAGDTDGDAVADFQIELAGLLTLTIGDFFL
jgi:trimeric autotransporter adhesin